MLRKCGSQDLVASLELAQASLQSQNIKGSAQPVCGGGIVDAALGPHLCQRPDAFLAVGKRDRIVSRARTKRRFSSARRTIRGPQKLQQLGLAVSENRLQRFSHHAFRRAAAQLAIVSPELHV